MDYIEYTMCNGIIIHIQLVELKMRHCLEWYPICLALEHNYFYRRDNAVEGYHIRVEYS